MKIDIKHSDKILEMSMNLNEGNTFTKEAFELIGKSFDDVNQDDSYNVLLLSSSLEEYFSNGLDPSLFLDRNEKDVREACEIIIHTSKKLLQASRPTICLIEGHCMGAGTVFALYCDWRYMVDTKARIGFPEINIGMNFPSGPALQLIYLTGRNNARDLLFHGNLIKGPEAKSLGMVDFVYPREEIREAVYKHAQKIAKLAPAASRGVKASLNRHMLRPLEEVTQEDIDNMVRTILTENAQEGFRSIVEKRRPKFT